jgi:hypothetical protein
MSEYTTLIRSNGSKWAGESPDDIGGLLNRLAAATLDPTFEHYGNFINADESDLPGGVRFFGNFFDWSHVFTIDTNDPVIIEQLSTAIRANQRTEKYAKAREARIEEDRAIDASQYCGPKPRAARWSA